MCGLPRTRFAERVPEAERKPRVLIAVEPFVLGEALAGLLAEAGDDVVVLEPEQSPATVTGDYDAAIVTIVLPDDVSADVIIELPDHEGNRGTGTLRRGTEVQPVVIESLDDLLGLLP